MKNKQKPFLLSTNEDKYTWFVVKREKKVWINQISQCEIEIQPTQLYNKKKALGEPSFNNKQLNVG